VRAGDERALAAVAAAGRDIGEVLAACVSVVNPSLIVIGGSMAGAGDVLLDGIVEVVSSRGSLLATAQLDIVLSGAGEDAAVLGAAALAAEHALSPTGIDAMLNHEEIPA
jgi:glucokinase